ncbi:hypothetical protein Ddc_19695 [Ditylenchus destructor]|nr:hypothetical protein Ddc_19695 [Ditylenchus destructor]
MDAELVLQQTGGGREDHVRRGRGDDDQIDLVGADAGGLQRGQRCGQRQIAGRDVRRGEMAGVDAGALHDPVVRGLDPVTGEALGQILIGDAGSGKMAARTENAGVARGSSGHAAWAAEAALSPASPPSSLADAGSACSVATMRS